MSSKFNELLHGDLQVVESILSGDNPPEDLAELRAALTNVVNRVARLELAFNAAHPDRPL